MTSLFYFGANVQISLRPVCWGDDSTLAISSSCSITCRMIRWPSSICAISRPRKITETVTLSLWPKKVRALFILNSISCSPVFGRKRISLSFVWWTCVLCSFFFCWYLNFPKSIILQTGGRSLGATSTKSRPAVRASDNASSVGIIPSWAPSALMTRIGEIRICSLMRCCFSMAKKLQTRDGYCRAGGTVPRTLHHGQNPFIVSFYTSTTWQWNEARKFYVPAEPSSPRSYYSSTRRG